MRYDVCIVGAGLIGLGVARALVDSHPGISLLILEKEGHVAAHQSSHNSGVTHSGLYYRPGSLKARLCVQGRRRLEELCESAGIPFRRTGKIVVATKPSELGALDELQRRGTENGLVGIRRLDSRGIREIEPEATGLEALHVPEAGVADFPALADHLAEELRRHGGEIRTGHGVEVIRAESDGVSIVAGGEEYRARVVVNCAGLQSDRVAELAGIHTSVRIIPFRGEYYTLAPEAARLVNALVYPVPDPRFPFLGVHFTRRIDDSVEVGPNAVLALGREHYRGTRADWSELWGVIRYPGFRKLAGKHWSTGAAEMVRSRSRFLYARAARTLIPAVRPHHLIPGGAGVRAQAVSSDGRLMDDFVIEETESAVHVLNAPSPGATASLAIGSHVADMVGRHLT